MLDIGLSPEWTRFSLAGVETNSGLERMCVKTTRVTAISLKAWRAGAASAGNPALARHDARLELIAVNPIAGSPPEPGDTLLTLPAQTVFLPGNGWLGPVIGREFHDPPHPPPPPNLKVLAFPARVAIAGGTPQHDELPGRHRLVSGRLPFIAFTDPISRSLNGANGWRP